MIYKERKAWYGSRINELKNNQIFVFGSNTEGRHGAGSAKAAIQFGAKYGVGRGLVGNSYALVTKNLTSGFFEKETGITYEKEGFRSLTKEQIQENIKELYQIAKENPDLEFLIAYTFDTYINGGIKKGLNGYDSQEMMNMFLSVGIDKIPENIIFHKSYLSRFPKSSQ